jgi:hypothetical protein
MAQHIKERREGEGEPFTGDELLQRWKAEAAALGECGARARGEVCAGRKDKNFH